MKFWRQLTAGAVACMLAMTLAACGKGTAASAGAGGGTNASSVAASVSAPAQMNEYVSKSGVFSITVPNPQGGEWTVTDGGNDDHVVLDNKDRSLTILVQRLPRPEADAMYDSLEQMAQSYRKNNLSNLGDPTPETVDVPAAQGVLAESYSVAMQGVSAKALATYFQTDRGYYIYAITGLDEQYDADIAALRAAISNFREND